MNRKPLITIDGWQERTNLLAFEVLWEAYKSGKTPTPTEWTDGKDGFETDIGYFEQGLKGFGEYLRRKVEESERKRM